MSDKAQQQPHSSFSVVSNIFSHSSHLAQPTNERFHALDRLRHRLYFSLSLSLLSVPSSTSGNRGPCDASTPAAVLSTVRLLVLPPFAVVHSRAVSAAMKLGGPPCALLFHTDSHGLSHPDQQSLCKAPSDTRTVRVSLCVWTGSESEPRYSLRDRNMPARCKVSYKRCIGRGVDYVGSKLLAETGQQTHNRRH